MLGAPVRLLGTPYAVKQAALLSPANQMPCTAPPYAELVAVDLQAGTILWQSTLGVWDHSLPPPMASPFSLPLPLRWGTPTFGGPMLTAGGLVFIGATGDDRFRAFETRDRPGALAGHAAHRGLRRAHELRGGRPAVRRHCLRRPRLRLPEAGRPDHRLRPARGQAVEADIRPATL